MRLSGEGILLAHDPVPPVFAHTATTLRAPFDRLRAAEPLRVARWKKGPSTADGFDSDGARARFLAALRTRDGADEASVARRFGTDLCTLAPWLHALEADGLIERAASDEAVELWLTPYGRALASLHPASLYAFPAPN